MREKIIKVGLIGNPNTGKTSLLNTLTGLDLHVGNWPGKTVEKKQGAVNFKNHTFDIIDLPGTYSVSPYSEEEKIARNFILGGQSDVIVQIIDVNALERNLLLTFELLALRKKIILAFNFNKEARKKGIVVATQKIQKILEVPIVEIEANTGENKNQLLTQIISTAKQNFHEPVYLKKLLKKEDEISHRLVMSFIKKNIDQNYKVKNNGKKVKNIDGVILNKYSAFPIFIAVIFLMFKATFSLSAPIMNQINNLSAQLGAFILSRGWFPLLSSFVVHGIIGGIFSVLAFTPLIFIMFLIIALLEDSGYLARTVILVDRMFQKFGISGRSFIPMILGFGCNVPAIMATRIIRSRKERYISIFIIPFMSCSARLPVYVLFAGIFFPHYATLAIMTLYLLGMLIALLASLFLSKVIKSKENNALIIELPPYRWPTVKTIFRTAWMRTYLFIKKAGSIILVAVIAVWFLANLPSGVAYGSKFSILGQIGQFFTPIFKPLGFGHWAFVVALIFGAVAKEVIIGMLGTLYGVSHAGLAGAMATQITPLGAFSFLTFVLLYIPCLATIAVIKKETGSWKLTILHFFATLTLAWLVSFAVYQFGSLMGF